MQEGQGRQERIINIKGATHWIDIISFALSFSLRFFLYFLSCQSILDHLELYGFLFFRLFYGKLIWRMEWWGQIILFLLLLFGFQSIGLPGHVFFEESSSLLVFFQDKFGRRNVEPQNFCGLFNVGIVSNNHID